MSSRGVNPPPMMRLNPKSKKLCSCCDVVAIKKVEIATSRFRGDDDVFLLCQDYVSIVEQQAFADLYYDFAMTRFRRAKATKPKNSRSMQA